MSRTFDEHLKKLGEVLQRITMAGQKCSLFQRILKYLGHFVTSEEILTDEDKIRAVNDWPRPQNLHELCLYRHWESTESKTSSKLLVVASSKMKEVLNEFLGVTKTLEKLTTPRHPRSDLMVERFSRNLKEYLRKAAYYNRKTGTNTFRGFNLRSMIQHLDHPPKQFLGLRKIYPVT